MARGHLGRIDIKWVMRLVSAGNRGSIRLAGGLSASLVAVGASVVSPLLVRHSVDEYVRTGHVSPTLVSECVALTVLAVVGAFSTWIANYVSGTLGVSVEAELRRHVFSSIERMDGYQRDKLNQGSLASTYASDIGTVQQLMASTPNTLSSGLQAVAVVVVMVALSPVLAAVVLVLLPILAVLSYRSARQLAASSKEQAEARSRIADRIERYIEGIRVVKGFGQEEREHNELMAESKTLRRIAEKINGTVARFLPLFQGLPVICQAIVLIIGGVLVYLGSLSVGTYLAFNVYIGLLVAPLVGFSGQLTKFQVAKISAGRVFAAIDSEPTIQDPPRPKRVPSGPLSLEFDDVALSYEANSTPAVEGVSFVVEPGETVAIVGESGSGKSTLLSLVLRFYESTSGRIKIGGIDVRDLAVGDLRRQISAVFDDSFLFSTSVESNIGFGSDPIDMGEVKAAAAMARAEDFIAKLEHGYQTGLGDRGMRLSGGQRQRLAIARALAKQSRILLFDDATSAVDAGVENEVNAALRVALEGRTAIIVAHRRSSLDLADRVVVMERGRIRDIGTHDELVSRCRAYRTLVGIEEVTSARFARSVVQPPDNPPDGADVAPTDNVVAPDPVNLRRGLVRGLGLGIAVSTAFVILEAAGQVVSPWVIGNVIEAGTSRRNLADVIGWGTLALIVAIAGMFIMSGNLRVVGRTGPEAQHILRRALSERLSRLGLAFYERQKPGELLLRMTVDVYAVSGFIQSSLGQLVVALLAFLGSFAVMVWMNFDLSLVVIAIVLVFVALLVWYKSTAVKAYGEARDRLDTVNAAFKDQIQGVRTVQVYDVEGVSARKFAELATEYYRAGTRAQSIVATLMAGTRFLGDIAVVAVLAVGIYFASNGSITTGSIVAFMLYLGLMFRPIQQLSSVLDAYQRASVAFSRIGKVLTATDFVAELRPSRNLSRLEESVRVQDVSFRYSQTPDENYAVRDLDISIHQGKSVAIIGPSGAGKSTVLKLLARFYDPGMGSVLFDDVDIQRANMASFRSRVSIVTQEPYLFGSKIGEVISYGRRDSSHEQIRYAAQSVGADDMICSLPGKYESSVLGGGQNLSAGQRQLLALARAELVNPDVLLLDEATASLDLVSEQKVANALRSAAAGRTTVVIAHRLRTASACDYIYVLDGGEVVEAGSHQELIEHAGLYAELWTASESRPAPIEPGGLRV